MVRRVVAVPGAVPISERDRRRARWVLDMVGAPGLRPGEDVPYRPEAWEAVERGRLPDGDELAAGFFHLARVEERGAERDPHGRFLAASSCLDPLEPLLETGAEVGLHGSYLAAEDLELLARERALLAQLDGPLIGQRYHYLRVDPHRNLAPLAGIGFRYDTSLGFPDALGFRAGTAHPFRPWDFERERPADLVEVPLAVMDATLAEERYAGLSAAEAKPRVLALLDWAAEHGGAFSILWHPERFDGPSARGWDRLYFELIEAVRERGGTCLAAGELAGLAAERFGLPRDQ